MLLMKILSHDRFFLDAVFLRVLECSARPWFSAFISSLSQGPPQGSPGCAAPLFGSSRSGRVRAGRVGGGAASAARKNEESFYHAFLEHILPGWLSCLRRGNISLVKKHFSHHGRSWAVDTGDAGGSSCVAFFVVLGLCVGRVGARCGKLRRRAAGSGGGELNARKRRRFCLGAWWGHLMFSGDRVFR